MTVIRLGVLTTILNPAGTGINLANRGIVATEAGPVEAFVKQLDAEELTREVVCAVLAQALGLPCPDPVVVFVPPRLGGPALAYGSVAIGHPNLHHWIRVDEIGAFWHMKAWPMLNDAACFDEWIANGDRHGGNLLFDGKAGFWLIDHGLSMSVSPSAPSPSNKLFDLVRANLTPMETEDARGNAHRTMERYAATDVAAVLVVLEGTAVSDHATSSVLPFLAARQPHLVRLGRARLPTAQQDIFDGGPAF